MHYIILDNCNLYKKMPKSSKQASGNVLCKSFTMSSHLDQHAPGGT